MDDRMPVPVNRGDLVLQAADAGYMVEAQGGQQQGLNIVTVILRRWRLVLFTALLACACGIPLIWLLIRPLYTAVSAIKVDPVIQGIVFQDESGTLPFYSNYVRTQAELIKGPRIMYPVLEAPDVRGLDYLKQFSDPMLELQTNLDADADKDTQLLRVMMTATDAKAAAVIANAAVTAYMRIEGGTEATSEDTKLRTLERERDSASEKLRGLYEAAYDLGEEFGTTDLTSREQVMLARVQALQEQLTQVQTMRLMLEMQEGRLKAEREQPQNASEYLALRNNHIRNDMVVSTLNARIVDMELDIALLSLRVPDNSSDLAAKRRALDSTKTALDSAMEKAGKEFDELNAQVQAGAKDKAVADIQEQIIQAKAQEELIKQELDKQNTDVIALGRKGLAINKLQDEIQLTRDLYQTITQRIQVLQVERQRPARVSVAYEAEVPKVPSKDKRAKFTAVLVIGSLVFACAFVVFLHEIDPRVETPSEVEARCGLRVLGTTPRFEDLDKARVKPKHFVDDCRAIRVNLMLAAGDKPVKSLVIASPQGRDGKTTLAINLATSVALAGKRVLLIDGDLRKPEVARYLRISNARGLTDVLSGACSLEEAIQPTILPTLNILPSNRRNHTQTEFFAGASMAELIKRSTTLYDEVIIDTPAVLAMPDAKLWASMVDGVVLVGRSSKTGARDLMETKTRIQQAGAKILGVVLTGVRIGDSYEKYQHRYGEGFVDEPVSEDDWSATRVFLLSRNLEDENNDSDGQTS